MKTQKHDLNIQICLEDLRDPVDAVNTVFDIIEKVKAAVFTKGGKVVSFRYDSTPTPIENPLGVIATLSFDIRTPYECEATLEFGVISSVMPLEQEPRRTNTVDFKIKL